MAGAFRDFIPEGEDTGGQGNGFQDFVPAPKPQVVKVEELEVIQDPELPEIIEKPKTKKGK